MNFNFTVKHALAGALLATAGALPALAQQNAAGQQPAVNHGQAAASGTSPVAGAGTQPGQVFGQHYAPVGKVGTQQAQIVYYRDASAAASSSAADVYIDGNLQTALLTNGYTVFCVKPGEHTLGAYLQDAPLYKGKTTDRFSAELKGGATYFLKVAPAGSDGVPVVVPRDQAEAQLRDMRAQMHVLSRAQAVEACDTASVPAPAPAPVVKAPQAKDYVLKGDALFAFGKSGLRDMSAEGRQQIARVADQIRAESGSQTVVTVIGHADLIGSDEAAQKLGEQRAMTVRRVLIERGIPSTIIHAESAGNSVPVVEECSGTLQQQVACNAPNRRVVVRVSQSRPA